MKKVKILLSATIMSALITTTAFAGEWKHDSSGWWWRDDNGSYPVNGWEWIDGNHDGIFECYYFDPSGYLLTNCETPDNRQVNSDGAWVVGGVVQTNNGGTNINNSATRKTLETENTSDSQSSTDPLFNLDLDDCNVVYTGYKIKRDYDNNPCLVLYYNFTNKQEEPQGAWISDHSITVFQNGVECDTAFIFDDRDEPMDNYSKDVMKDTTINVAQSFILKDMSDVTIRVEEIWNWDNPQTQTATLKIQ